VRLFIALELSGQQKKEIRELQQRLHSYLTGVKWVQPAGLHLTLKFLGEVDPVRVPDILEAVKSAASETEPFLFRFGGSGVFPSPRKARVVWVGLRECSGPVSALAEALNENLIGIGFPADGRPFKPHLTLGRLREALPVENIERFIDQEHSFSSVWGPVEGVTLYRSDLNRHGAVYTPVQKILFR
jgi:RNA 2',3'-cyclic 3'-phosphodiesterase